ncbi:hypothetical protein TWF730_011114 [Orbilia blumenaviensis]|uniref:F-box domain-containing protein n=1 Tax=Orbilia blumenaviensis TaxID=1796055 RepID=A0AAV9UKL9_9PEZI
MDLDKAPDRAPVILPTEIKAKIISFATLDTLKAFSLSSMTNCQTAGPALFSHVKLTTESLQSFQEGALVALRPAVQHITLHGLTGPVYTLESQRRPGVPDPMPELMRTYANSLFIFPNLKSIKIPFTGPFGDVFPSAFLSEILHKIAEFPGRLQVLDLDYVYTDPDVVTWMALYTHVERDIVLTADTQEKPELADVYPIIENLKLTVTRDMDFSCDSRFWKFSHCAVLRSNSQTLRKLSLTFAKVSGYTNDLTNWISHADTFKITFPALEEASIVFHKHIFTWCLDIFVRMFPNVQYLSIDTPSLRDQTRNFFWAPNPNRVLYQEFRPLQKLKKLRVVWPQVTREDWDGWYVVRRAQIEVSVSVLAELGPLGLEYVEVLGRNTFDSYESCERDVRPHLSRHAIFRITRTPNGVVLV